MSGILLFINVSRHVMYFVVTSIHESVNEKERFGAYSRADKRENGRKGRREN